MERHGHPRYDGPVVDMHVHYDAATRERAAQVNALGGLRCAINLWDSRWPPTPVEHELEQWRRCEPALLRCWVPDCSHVGAPGFAAGIERELAAAVASGCVGVKVWKNVGLSLRDVDGRLLCVDDRRLDVLWEGAGRAGLPVLIHVGDPPAFWQPMTPENPRWSDVRDRRDCWYADRDVPALAALQEQFERVVQRHPGTVFVAAHWGCYVPDPERWLAAYPNWHLDTAAAIGDMGHGDVAAVRRVFERFPDRVLFGTDLARTADFEYPDQGPARRWDLAEYFARHWRFFETGATELEHPIPEQLPWTVQGLDLPDATLRALYHDNAARLYRLPEAAE